MNLNQKAPDKTRCCLRLFVAAYLIYLGVSILKGVAADGGMSIPLVIAAVVFILFGVGYAVFSLRILIGIMKAERENKDSDEHQNPFST